MEEVVFQWLGTAGFRIEYSGRVLLIDPFVTRNERARPVQDLRPSDLADAELIFISHGHFDHMADVPAIVEASGAHVYCTEVASETLFKHGVPSEAVTAVQGTEVLDLDGFSVALASSKHIRFDAKLVLTTLPGVLRHAGVLRELGAWPAGPVLVHTFDFDGLKVMHMGSLGVTPEVAERLGLSGSRPDILMPPLQGHTDICARAAVLTGAIRPRGVVPQHYDDFSPPLSRYVDIEPFKHEVARLLPECSCYEPAINARFTAQDVLGGS